MLNRENEDTSMTYKTRWKTYPAANTQSQSQQPES
ncbi:hypothetical protein PITC_014980 [Penicillium italicum]|uniref:Uncharacterized protein n=1 Tax=Penicillium italicum TaxID=40296 RepID=A0A0A2L197_PENIT|nr:hypothetical protein PITC_014980 [Penicillium italicum]